MKYSIVELSEAMMAILNVLHFPDPRLRNQALPAEQVDAEVQQLVNDMFDTMYELNGIGLAATQVDVALQVIVIDLSENKEKPLCLINPEILDSSGTETMEEGCLSVPGIWDKVTRASHIKVTALDREGKRFELETGGLLAVCIQHEMDHLKGKLFVDYLSPLKRQRVIKKLKKLRKQIL